MFFAERNGAKFPRTGEKFLFKSRSEQAGFSRLVFAGIGPRRGPKYRLYNKVRRRR
jgi:hypothetical protein